MSKLNYKTILPFCLCLLSGSGGADIIAAELKFDNNTLPVIPVIPEKSTGIDCLYVCNDINGVTISYTSEGNNKVNWYRFSNMGAAFNEPVNNVIYDGNKSSIQLQKNDTGFFVEDGEKTYYFWIIDYSKYPLNLLSISPSEEQDCNSTNIDISGSGEAIHYYTINGRQETLSRDLRLSYLNLEWDADATNFLQIKTDKILPYISSSVILTPPVYSPTTFTLTGDRFLEEWKQTQSVESAVFTPIAVTAETEAIQSSDNNDDNDSSNMIPSDNDGMGGSAPVEISFRSYPSDAVIHHEWQMSTDEQFDNITYRINEQDFDYTFNDEGTTYIRYIGSNSDGSCESIGETYTVNVGASELQIPNAFSPNDDGINDEWKVSYRSLLDFHCWIFDRHGHRLYEFTDPSQGWDGKHNGKVVSPGVYYYVIMATGSDGKRYKKSGDINIIRYKGGKSSSSDD
jgi:gliding motility-associated-like protein